jgi:hypothetical protein
LAQLLFGRAIATGGGVSDAAWRDFLAREVTPRFPDGLTVLDGYGQWRGPASKEISHEAATVVEIVGSGDQSMLRHLNEVRSAYEAEFQQESVGLVLVNACADFGK